jgi:histidyl-tRNA synthetase
MRDILPPESARWRQFVVAFAETVTAAGYGQIIPPLLEDIGVFHRVGEATDIVTKEMYDFVDKGDRHVALRPEQTASVCRAFVQHRPATPWKVWYSGPNFRYERPQRGRYRQFDQVGIEVLGANDPYLDVEVIALGWNFFQRLGLQQVHLHLNSLGEPQDRQNFVAALQTYFSANIEQLSDASKVTLTKNALRVLDSKRPEDFDIIAKAPKISDFYSEAARTHFETVLSGLRTLNIPFTVNEKLVRGLDYYRHTTFEFVGGTLDSAQNAIGGGGRYDGLVEDLGGPATAGIGFALGLDRTLLACDDEGVFASVPDNVDVFVVDTTGGNEALVITHQLRNAGISCDRSFENRSMKSQMKAADKSGALVAIIIGSDEVEANAFVLRPLRGEEQQSTIPRSELIPSITKALS